MLEENTKIKEKINTQLLSTEHKIQDKLDSEILALQRFVNRWEFRGGYNQLDWENDVEKYITNREGYQAIEWVDKNNIVRWVVPKKGNEEAIDLFLPFEEKRSNALAIAKQEKKVFISDKVDLVQGIPGFLIYNPLFVDDNFDGFILGVFNINSFFYRLLRTEAIQGYQAFIYQNNQLIYSTTYTEEKDHIYWRQSTTLNYRGISWKITLIPNNTLIQQNKSPLPLVVLVGGLTISWLLAWGVNSLFKLQERTHLLEKARREAEEANSAKSEFLAMMSHELRTPLNGVVGIINLLKDTPLNLQQQDFVNTLRDSSSNLILIINDILDFSKIESGKLELVIDNFNIQKCVKSVIDLLSFQAKDQGLDLICLWDATMPNFIRGDASRLRQILINLIGNALKFTSRGEVRVTISSEHIKNRTDYDEYLIKFAIRDTGIGISTENQARLFKPFSQGDGRVNRRYGGTGLGLVISQRLAALMGGDIWLESEVGVGSTFYFTIKATSILNGVENDMDYSCVLDKPCKESFTSAEVVKEGKTLPLKILVAEDNRVNQKVILLLLKKLGYQPDLAVNGLEVIRAVETCNYDVILMDMQMPEMDGIGATKWIRENLPLSIQPHIIAMTANASKIDEKVCLSSGMNDFISKPFEFELVERKLKNLRRS